MPTLTKLAPASTHARRPSFDGMFGALRKALASRPPQRGLRPHQDIDGWSDQAEVAFYEDCRGCRFG